MPSNISQQIEHFSQTLYFYFFPRRLMLTYINSPLVLCVVQGSGSLNYIQTATSDTGLSSLARLLFALSFLLQITLPRVYLHRFVSLVLFDFLLALGFQYVLPYFLEKPL